MTKEIRSPNVERRSGVQLLVRHSDFSIPSDFVIRHSSFGFENGGSWKEPLRHWDDELDWVASSVRSPAFRRFERFKLPERRKSKPTKVHGEPGRLSGVHLRP